jgi:tetratricopeptide (TPR) repeat protein
MTRRSISIVWWGAPIGEANVLKGIGHVRIFLGEPEAAQASFEQALALYRAHDAKLGQANALAGIGNVQRGRAAWEDALASYGQALGLYQEVGHHRQKANIYKRIGDVQHSQGQHEAALVSYAQSLAQYRAVRDQVWQAIVLTCIGNTQRNAAQQESALASYATALDLYRAVGNQRGEAAMLAAQSTLLIDRQPQQSRDLLEQAVALRIHLDDIQDAATALSHYGMALLDSGRDADGLPVLLRARQMFALRDLYSDVADTDQLIARARQLGIRSGTEKE